MRSTVHEMRNQLAVAVANIEAIIDGKLAPTPERLGSVLAALGRLDVLMNDVPGERDAISAAPQMAAIDVCALIAGEKLAMEASAAAAGIALDADVCVTKHPNCAHFVCDSGQVSQVIKNLLLNAIKYTGPGGRVKIYCHRDPGALTLEISDSGPGVPVAERQAIFERGVRGSAAAAACGSGVGLAVVRDILDAHGGTVSVDDSAIGGARFVIRLPGNATAVNCADCARHANAMTVA
jgi:signal transduction histidine kinase